MTRLRTRGLRQIVRFNWPFYAAALAIVVAAPPAIARLPGGAPLRALMYGATGLVLFWLVASLVASWIVYDCSRLMQWDWILQALGFNPASWINLHTGFDEATPRLQAIFTNADGRVFDIFDPAEMTEPSIARARLRSRREPERGGRDAIAIRPERADFRCLPLASG
ncbi:MAG TPA: hypothetical protein VEL79_19810, partial [Vicinamibacterales bacterium]|nr:hypothetical protein [Vicinamibacterales bacterium]